MNEAGTLAFFCSIVAAMTFGEGLAARPSGQDAPEGSALPSQRYHDTDLTVPLADGDTYLGDIAVTVRTGNQGVKAPLGRAGPIYSSEPAFSGFYRRGLTDRLTLGANIQADRETQMAGIESILSMPFGSLGANLAVSQVQNRGMGYAALLTFHSLLERQNATADVLDVSAEIWSDDFAPAGSLFSRNPSSYRLGASYSHAFTDWLYAGADLHYSKGRESSPDSAVYRASIGWRPLPRMNFTANAGYLGSTRNGRPGFILQATFTLQLGANSSAMAAYDSALHSERLSYQMQHGNVPDPIICPVRWSGPRAI